MYDKILVPLDGSKLAEGALPYVHTVATRLNSEVMLLTARKAGQGQEIVFEAYLEKKAEALESAGVSAGWSVVNGNAADETLRFCEKNHIDLMIMSTNGESGHTEWAIGKVTGELLQRARIPVLLVRHAGPNGADSGNPLRKVLVPLDGSTFAEQIVPCVQALGDANSMEVVLLRVIEPRDIPHIAIAEPGLNWSEYENRLAAGIERVAAMYLAGIESQLREAGVKVSSLILHGKPAATILQHMEDNAFDLIALVTHGLSAMDRWAYGSVAWRIIEKSSKPILLLRPPLPSRE